MSYDSIVQGPYGVPPSPEDYRIRAGMDIFQPENIEGVVLSKPDFVHGEHKIILEFAIARTKRPGGQRIPCSMCSREHPKYYTGALLWSSDGWLRVIGHQCAEKKEHFGAVRYKKMQQERSQRELDDAAFGHLESNIELIKTLRPHVVALKTAMEFMEGQQKRFAREVPALAAELLSAAKRNGRLMVVREIPANRIMATENMASGLSTRSATSRYEEIDVGTLRGATFLHLPSKFSRSRRVEGVLGALDMLPEGDAQEALLTLIDGGDNHVIVTAITVSKAVGRVLALARDYADAAEFISQENIAALDRWGQHPDNPLPCSVQRSAQEIIFRTADLSRARLSPSWPAIVDFSKWQQIADAEATLEDKHRSQRGTRGG